MSVNAAQRSALVRHGYDPDLPARGTGGGPGVFVGVGGMRLRNHVCYLDDIEIDGHEFSDLDVPGPGSTCLHCEYEVEWRIRDSHLRHDALVRGGSRPSPTTSKAATSTASG